MRPTRDAGSSVILMALMISVILSSLMGGFQYFNASKHRQRRAAVLLARAKDNNALAAQLGEILLDRQIVKGYYGDSRKTSYWTADPAKTNKDDVVPAPNKAGFDWSGWRWRFRDGYTDAYVSTNATLPTAQIEVQGCRADLLTKTEINRMFAAKGALPDCPAQAVLPVTATITESSATDKAGGTTKFRASTLIPRN